MKVTFHESTRGDKQVEEFYLGLEVNHKKKVLNWLDRLELRGLALMKTEDVKKVEENLYELRVLCHNNYYRIFFVTVRDEYRLIFAFNKKTKKIPKIILQKIRSIRDLIIGNN